MKSTQVGPDLDTVTSVVAAVSSTALDLKSAGSFAILAGITVDANTAKTFDSGVAALLAVQDLTYTADLRGTAGNSITIAYTAGGTAGAEVVTVVGSAISVSIDVTPVTGSTATQVKTAVDASVAASALISVAVTGTGATVQAAASATPLATGVASEVDVSANTVSIPAHLYKTGLKGQLTSTGTLPAGLATSTDYYIIAVSSSVVAFATSYVNAIAGTKIDITDQGSSGAVNTFTATALAGATVVGQWSLDGTTYINDGSPTSITVTTSFGAKIDRPPYYYYKLTYAITAGSLTLASKAVVNKDIP